MKTLIRKKYVLEESKEEKITSIGQVTSLNLKYTNRIDEDDVGEFTGKVTDLLGIPIPNALVKLMSTDYNPISHGTTDGSGNYIISNILPGTYNIFAISDGKKLNEIGPISIAQFQSKQVNFILEDDPSTIKSVITGHVLDVDTYKPVNQVIVSLVDVVNNIEDIKGVTYTNEYGQFIFPEVSRSHYKLIFTHLDYIRRTRDVFVDVNGRFFDSTNILGLNSNVSRRSLSGIISNYENQPVNEADVILYEVNQNDSLTPVSYTKTNINGVYLFNNVPTGTYKIKSNKMETIDVDF